jgi:cardiolipin synthase
MTDRPLVDRLTDLLARDRVDVAAQALDLGPSSLNDVRLLVDGEVFYPDLLEAIRTARSSVHAIQFGYKAGAIGSTFTDALAERARDGVAVRMLLDWAGSALFGPSTGRLVGRLVDAGVQVVVNSPFHPFPRTGPLGGARPRRPNPAGFGRTDHRKLWAIDGRIGYVGGAGVEDHFNNGEFHDLYVRVEGEVVGHLQYLFLAAFRNLGGPSPTEDVNVLAPLAPDDAQRTYPVRVLGNVPTAGSHAITDAVYAELGRATTTLDVISPYITQPAVIRALIAAAGRGVAVRLVVPGKPNNHVAAAGMRHHYRDLIDAGVAIWEYPAVAHAKAIVRDGSCVLVGTLNLDALSLSRNLELMLRIDAPVVGAAFRAQLFDRDVALSVPGEPCHGILSRVLGQVAASLSSQL